MKLLLDENLPHDLRHFLAGHEVFTVAFMGWSGLTNGALLLHGAAEGFEALITLDAGVEFQQNLSEIPMAVVKLRADNNKLESLIPLVPDLLNALSSLTPNSLVVVG